MRDTEFRKLAIELPQQPLVRQRPWWIAGLILAFIILGFVVLSYVVYKKSPKPLPLPHKEAQ